MEAKFVTGRDEFPLDFYTSIFVRDAALVCATLSEGEGGNDQDWNKMSPFCNILKYNLALGGLRVQLYSTTVSTGFIQFVVQTVAPE